MNEKFNYVCTMSGRVKNFDKLHMYAALLQDKLGWCCLVPVDESKYVQGPIIEGPAEWRKNLSYLDMHKQKIDVSDALFVYLDDNELLEEYKKRDTMKEIKYAMDNYMDIYFSTQPKDLDDEWYVYMPSLDHFIKVGEKKVINGAKWGKQYIDCNLFEIKYTRLEIGD